MKKITEVVERHFLAEVISWLFFPPLVGTVFFIFLIFWYSTDLNQGLRWLVVIAPFLMFIPLIFFATSFKLGWISDIDLSHRQERPTFLLVFVVSLFAAAMILYFLHVPLKFFVYVFSGLVMMIIASLITLGWKISFHTAVVTSVVTAIVILGGFKFWPFLLLIPIIGWARVALGRHTLSEVIGGASVALIVTASVFYLFGFRLFF